MVTQSRVLLISLLDEASNYSLANVSFLHFWGVCMNLCDHAHLCLP